jgi:hypothetical protein
MPTDRLNEPGHTYRLQHRNLLGQDRTNRLLHKPDISRVIDPGRLTLVPLMGTC